MTMDIEALILQAKLGSARKDAQVDTCTVFAAALHDVLSAAGVDCAIATAEIKGRWAHALVRVGNRYFDSKGEFSTAIHCMRAKIHKSVVPHVHIEFSDDACGPVYEDEFDALYAFFVKELRKSMAGVAVRMEALV
jgi:hypothetical protein